MKYNSDMARLKMTRMKMARMNMTKMKMSRVMRKLIAISTQRATGFYRRTVEHAHMRFQDPSLAYLPGIPPRGHCKGSYPAPFPPANRRPRDGRIRTMPRAKAANVLRHALGRVQYGS